ncbi:hypothetical protein ACFL27_17760, partial [candidate division CSSED10-310 bacterium]
DLNYFSNPFDDSNITVEAVVGDRTLEQWQTYSGLDGNSTKNWFTLGAGEQPLSEVFYNPSDQQLIVDLGTQNYLDLDQNPVSGNLTLPAYGSEILVKTDTPVPTINPFLALLVFSLFLLRFKSRA